MLSARPRSLLCASALRTRPSWLSGSCRCVNADSSMKRTESDNCQTICVSIRIQDCTKACPLFPLSIPVGRYALASAYGNVVTVASPRYARGRSV
ncbi:hypothetical protein FA95DRAFT_1555566 [Auriscalpium vulgare]|uniref:Uncharacterized protein n=1 Tax=Auriscalpium vulgare TaxID=40419 RepID=A0ACB8S305_9AGAM|nr:hypothetical protein FA95DRAFT_1555566 [Auriscalpium vulgare]